MQTITKLWLIPSAKQRRDPCSGPPTDSTNYRKCVSNSLQPDWLLPVLRQTKQRSFLTGQSWCVLKSGYTAGSPEQGFRRCFADGVNQSLISSARRLPLRQGLHFVELSFLQSMKLINCVVSLMYECCSFIIGWRRLSTKAEILSVGESHPEIIGRLDKLTLRVFVRV